MSSTFALTTLQGPLQYTLLSVILLWAVVCAWPRLRMWWLGSKLPGPYAWPLVGNALGFLQSQEKTFFKIVNLFKEHGPVIRIWFGTKLVVGITSPADAQAVLAHPKVVNRDCHFNAALNGFIDNSLLSAVDEKHQLHRKLMNPAFHFKILGSYIPIFGQKTELMAAQLAQLADGQKIDIKEKLSICTLGSILETAIGFNPNLREEEMIGVKDLMDTGLDLLYKRLMHPWLLVDSLYSWTADGQKAMRTRKQFEVVFKALMSTTLDAINNRVRKSNVLLTASDKKVRSFLDMVFDTTDREANFFTEDEVREEIYTLAGAGMDTSSSVMSYVLMLLGMYPEYQEKVLKEQRAIFKDSLRPATLDDHPKMILLDYVIKEAMRLFPPASLYPREIPEDIKIPSGYVLPAGCTAFIFTYALQHSHDNFYDPERFWPERWAPENSVDRHPYAYLPFSAGPRNCLGQKYAQLQMKTVLSRLLRQFRFTCDYKMRDLNRIVISATNRSVVGYDVQIYPR